MASSLFPRNRCLVRSMVLLWLLRSRGESAEVVLGVRKRAGVFEAHAWTVAERGLIGDRPEVIAEFETLMTSAGPQRSVKRVLRAYLATLYEATGRELILSIVLAALCSLTEGIGIVLLIPTLQISGLNLMGQGRVQSYATAIDAGLRAIHLTPTLPLLLSIFVVLICARTLLTKMQTVAGSRVQQQIEAHLRERLHRAIVGADWLFLCRKRSADLVHVLTAEVERVGTATAYALMLAGDVLVTAIYAAVALALSAGVTLMVLGAGLVLAILLRKKTRALQEIGTAMVAGESASLWRRDRPRAEPESDQGL